MELIAMELLPKVCPEPKKNPLNHRHDPDYDLDPEYRIKIWLTVLFIFCDTYITISGCYDFIEERNIAL